MSLWQNSYWVLPQESLIGFYGAIPTSITQHDFYTNSCECLWWRGIPAPDAFDIEQILPPLKNWNNEVVWWGQSDFDHRFSITYAPNGAVGEVLIRVNCGADYTAFVRKIVDLAKEKRWAFVSSSGKIILPDYDTMLDDLQKSDAHKGFEPMRATA